MLGKIGGLKTTIPIFTGLALQSAGYSTETLFENTNVVQLDIIIACVITAVVGPMSMVENGGGIFAYRNGKTVFVGIGEEEGDGGSELTSGYTTFDAGGTTKEVGLEKGNTVDVTVGLLVHAAREKMTRTTRFSRNFVLHILIIYGNG